MISFERDKGIAYVPHLHVTSGEVERDSTLTLLYTLFILARSSTAGFKKFII